MQEAQPSAPPLAQVVALQKVVQRQDEVQLQLRQAAAEESEEVSVHTCTCTHHLHSPPCILSVTMRAFWAQRHQQQHIGSRGISSSTLGPEAPAAVPWVQRHQPHQGCSLPPSLRG